MSPERIRFSKSVTIEGFEIIIPTVEDFAKIGAESFNRCLLPFLISKDLINADDDLLEQMCNFDLFFMKNSHGEPIFKDDDNTSYLEILLEAFEFYFQKEVTLITGQDLKHMDEFSDYSDNMLSSVYFIDVKDSGIISRLNYDAISQAILDINYIERVKPEPVPEFDNDRQRDVYEKIMEGRRRNAEKNSMSIVDMIDIVQYGGKSFIPYKDILEFTIPQIKHGFSVISGIDAFSIEFSKYCGGADPKDLDLKHWMHIIKKINSQ